MREREHQQGPQTLAKRLEGDFGLEVPDDLPRAAQLQERRGPFLDRPGVQLDQSSNLRSGELLARELRIGRSPPQPERLVEHAERDLGLVRRPEPNPHQLLEAQRVHLAARHPQPISRRAGLEPVVTERRAQP